MSTAPKAPARPVRSAFEQSIHAQLIESATYLRTQVESVPQSTLDCVIRQRSVSTVPYATFESALLVTSPSTEPLSSLVSLRPSSQLPLHGDLRPVSESEDVE